MAPGRAAADLVKSCATLSHLFQAHACLIKTSPLLIPSAGNATAAVVLLRAYLRFDAPAIAVSLALQLPNSFLDSFFLSLSLQSCARAVAGAGDAIHSYVVKLGYCCDLFVQTALLEFYAKSGRLAHAAAIFHQLTFKDVFICNVMIAAYVAAGEVSTARNLLDGMPERDAVSYNTVIHGYVTKGDASSAREVFDEMPERDAFAWSSVISAYAKGKQPKEAVGLFRQMMATPAVEPDAISMVSVLSACGDIGAFGVGVEIHRYIDQNGIPLDVRLGTALIDMYAKCGDPDTATAIFDALPARDVLTWSTMVLGLANNGHADDALKLFSRMLSAGVLPNEVTFVGVLVACCHTGLVAAGKAYFRSMQKDHGIAPRAEHYGCMVDLLGRSGHIDEARQLIDEMQFPPDAVIWRALLGACRIHKNTDIAEEAMRHLVELEPDADGHYVLLSNIYAQASTWDGVAEVRTAIRQRQIQRVPGRSAIDVDGVVHEFVAGDKSHPRREEIYQKLREMMVRLKRAGYVPMTATVLANVDEEAKEAALAEHSEKLAVAFGLLCTSEGTTLRVTKNLRACEDCHEALKLVSAVYGRKLVVRDRNRFHHIAEGECSCGGYW